MRKNHFEKFFVCPHCKKPLVRKSSFEEFAKDDNQIYCKHCGIKISNTLKKMLEKQKS